MNLIEIMENKKLADYRQNSNYILYIEKTLVEYFFNWLQLKQTREGIFGEGVLNVNGEIFNIKLAYSPYFPSRFDRIYIQNQHIKYDQAIHLYKDLSLCLYHPIFDKPFLKIVPLVKMIPWITEWCVHYIEWKKYKVWLGREFEH